MLKQLFIVWLPLIAPLVIWVGAGFYFSRHAQKIPRLDVMELSGPLEAITLYRIAEVTNIVRRYYVQIDGKRVGSIKVGEVQHFPVTPGDHTLAVQIDWCRSRPLKVTKIQGQNLLLECGASDQDWRCLFTVFLRPKDYVYIARPA